MKSKGAGAGVEDRASQPSRYGASLEKHGQSKGVRVRQGGAGEMTTGSNSTWGMDFNGGGNCAKGKSERHGNAKGDSLHGVTRPIMSNIEVADRTESSGNSAKGAHEPGAKGAEKVSAARRFDA